MIIKDPPVIRRIVESLSMEHALRVLVVASQRELSVPHMVSELQVPSSSAYRLISELEKAGLLVKVRGGIRADGKRFDLWRTLVSSVTLVVEGDCTLELTPRGDMAGRYLMLWRKLSGGERV